MYRYETHLHTSPVSRCASATVREQLTYCKTLGFTGVFITNHFVNGNTTTDLSLSHEKQMEYYFSDYEAALSIGKELDIQVLLGVEISYNGTDFLVYGLDKGWYIAHPEILKLSTREMLAFFVEEGALVIHAHPYREAGYIDHIRLYPRSVHGVEVYNACRTDLENKMAEHYAKSYGLLPFAGSDNHHGSTQRTFGGMEFSAPIVNEADFVRRVKAGESTPLKGEINNPSCRP